ncbi:MAG: hypothetical protein WED04_09725 [Promethearchaeati archaeon SRVP18_Atabeyarchaeia-1]
MLKYGGEPYSAAIRDKVWSEFSVRRSRAYSLVALSILMVLVASTTPAAAADYAKVGVKVGDIATYRTAMSGSAVNKTVFLVYGIVGTSFYINYTYFLPNGAVSSQGQLVGDTVTGGMLNVLVTKNLTTNDRIYSGSPIKINDSGILIFGGMSRIINHARISGGLFEFWWDKDTGLVVKMNLYSVAWLNLTMISTTAWFPVAPPGLFDNPLALPLLVMSALVVALLVAILVVARRKKHR